MKVYKIKCYSSCGSYFSSYLQTVTVIASSKHAAICLVWEWLKNASISFIEDDYTKWGVEELADNVRQGVIDYHEDSDY